MKAEITTWSVEMNSPHELIPARPAKIDYELIQAEIPMPQLNRFLYASVGADWSWYMRFAWSFQQWQEYLERDEVVTWIAYVCGTPAGYFELERQSGDSVEIAYFGLLPQFIGKGLGGALLGDAIRKAWEFGGGRVWLHTCTLDHPAALANYQARGFKIFDVVELEEEVPDGPLQPWPGAYPDR